MIWVETGKERTTKMTRGERAKPVKRKIQNVQGGEREGHGQN